MTAREELQVRYEQLASRIDQIQKHANAEIIEIKGRQAAIQQAITSLTPDVETAIAALALAGLKVGIS